MKTQKANAVISAIKEAEREQEFKAAEVLKEIQPLLNDYFFGEFVCEGDALLCSFPNGQKVKLTAV